MILSNTKQNGKSNSFIHKCDRIKCVTTINENNLKHYERKLFNKRFPFQHFTPPPPPLESLGWGEREREKEKGRERVKGKGERESKREGREREREGRIKQVATRFTTLEAKNSNNDG